MQCVNDAALPEASYGTLSKQRSRARCQSPATR
jgi:hypothetical protein